MGKMNYCEQCGYALTEGSLFCENCGAPVPEGHEGSNAQEQIFTPRRNHGRMQQKPVQEAAHDGDLRKERRSGEPPQQRGGGMQSQQPRGDGAYRGNSAYGSEEAARRELERRSRYQQENLGGSWEQSWERDMDTEEEHHLSPIQYVLLGMVGVLIIALLTFGAFWAIGRTRGRSSSDRNAGQTEELQTGSPESKKTEDITILDTEKPEQTEAKQTEAQTESETQTEAETETETEQKQTETQPVTEPQTEPAQDVVLNYSDFTVTIPGSWKGKYGITQSGNACVFYHQASKALGSGGTLFTIQKYTDTSYKTLPNFKELGLGGGAAYVFVLPSDVQYPQDNEAVRNEYSSMAGALEQIRSGIRILVTGDGPRETEAIQIFGGQNQQTSAVPQTEQTNSGDYILPESSTRALTDTDVAGMTYDGLQMAINEIYARHGRKFTSESIRSYFESKSWYQGTVEADQFDDKVFSSVESQNIQFLLSRMNAQ